MKKMMIIIIIIMTYYGDVCSEIMIYWTTDGSFQDRHFYKLFIWC